MNRVPRRFFHRFSLPSCRALHGVFVDICLIRQFIVSSMPCGCLCVCVCVCVDNSGDAVEEGEEADQRGPSLQELHRV